MKPLFLLAITAVLANAESHPSWWTYASPEATTLVGMQLTNLRHSPFGAAIEAEFSPGGALDFPDLDCLRQAREIVISSPALLAAEAGSFPSTTVKDQAQQRGLRRSVYRGVTLWLPEQSDKPGVAQISEQLVLVGDRKTLQSAIDRSLSETGRLYSPLLPRAARFSQTGDLWVVALKLPDPLADLFVPLEADASDFLGQISVRDGLMVEASFDAGSDKAAAEFARGLQQKAPSFSAVARGLVASADQGRVSIALQVSAGALMAALNPETLNPETSPVPAPAAKAQPVAIQSVAAPPAAAPVRSVVAEIAAVRQPTVAAAAPSAPMPPEPVKFVVTHTETTEPQIVRIYGLDEGVKEIVLPPF